MKNAMIVASVLGALAVILGAFGAHGLKMKISPEQLASYQTGVTYQMYHVFAILIVGILYHLSPQKAFVYASYCFLFGIILFSGSIYILSTRDISGLTNTRWLGPITPIGGMGFILGWIFTSIGIYNYMK